MKKQVSSFRKGQISAFAEVKATYHAGAWTPQLRASWLKYQTSAWRYLQHEHPYGECISFYAGMVVTLKSHHCAVFSKQAGA